MQIPSTFVNFCENFINTRELTKEIETIMAYLLHNY